MTFVSQKGTPGGTHTGCSWAATSSLYLMRRLRLQQVQGLRNAPEERPHLQPKEAHLGLHLGRPWGRCLAPGPSLTLCPPSSPPSTGGLGLKAGSHKAVNFKNKKTPPRMLGGKRNPRVLV